jgi:hypothetical protein
MTLMMPAIYYRIESLAGTSAPVKAV